MCLRDQFLTDRLGAEKDQTDQHSINSEAQRSLHRACLSCPLEFTLLDMKYPPLHPKRSNCLHLS